MVSVAQKSRDPTSLELSPAPHRGHSYIHVKAKLFSKKIYKTKTRADVNIPEYSLCVAFGHKH